MLQDDSAIILEAEQDQGRAPATGGWYPEESPLFSVAGSDSGFSTQYGASASSPPVPSGTEKNDYFVSPGGTDTEVEYRPATARVENSDAGVPSVARTDSGTPPEASTTLAQPPSFTGRRAFQHPLPRHTKTLFPMRIGVPRRPSHRDKVTSSRWDWLGFDVTRRRCENGLILGAVILGIRKLAVDWGEIALAVEISLLAGLSVLYLSLRERPSPPRATSPLPPIIRPHSPALSHANHLQAHGPHLRDRTARLSASYGHSGQMSPSLSGGRDDRRFSGQQAADESTAIGARGCVWGTEPREYRDCLDDGALHALLLAPLIASAMLHDSFTQLSRPPTSWSFPWMIEPPLVLDSTPILPRHIDPTLPLDLVKAYSALATSRRNLVHLFTLSSFVLLVQLIWSLRLEVKQSKIGTLGHHTAMPSAAMERDSSDSGRSTTLSGTFWLKKGEWRRNLSVVGFAFLVTGVCVVVKIVTALVGHGVWRDMSASDIIIATLFNQFSLYVCVRLARRGFTLGELALVCGGATALVMETVNMTRHKIPIIRTPYIKTYRLPTPLLTFQLALIPGSLLTGFLLSPLLYLSRNLAQKPAHRLRFPREKDTHRRLLALGFYGGSLLVCGGIVGTWIRWCLGWRDPVLWVVRFLLGGKRAWTRPTLLGYWGALAMISVAGWSRQLHRARRFRRYVVPGRDANGSSTSPAGRDPSTTGLAQSSSASSGADQTGLSGVASQMMDAADQRMPVLSVNGRRKFFHALAVIMFIPGIAFDPAFTHLSFSVAFALFTFAEYVRYFALWPFGVSVHLFFNEFLDSKDSGTAILSHFYLLAGCASPLWLESRTQVMAYFGVLTLGIGDALASIVGKRVGRVKWCNAGGKTVEGSVAFTLSVLVSTIFLWAFGMVKSFQPVPYVIVTGAAALLEAFSAQNDNLILPMYGWALGTLLGV